MSPSPQPPASSSTMFRLEHLSATTVNFDLLLNTTCESMKLIEPWTHATSKVHAVVEIIERVHEACRLFFDALVVSRKVASRGCEFSQDSMHLCDFLLDESVSSRDIKDLLSRMRQLARHAHRDAQKVADCFRKVRRNFNEITNDIPSEISKIEIEEQLAIKKTITAERRGERVKMMKACGTAVTAIVGAVTAVAFPPALLVLPIALPLLILVADTFEWKNSKVIKKREEKAQDCNEAIKQLHNVTVDLLKLGDYVDVFADYWLTVDTQLEMVSNRLSGLRETKYALRMKIVRSNWEQISQSYLNYSVKLKVLKSILRESPLLRGSSGSSISSDESLKHKPDQQPPATLKRRNNATITR